MGIDVSQLRKYIIQPTLRGLGMYSQAAENLLLGTAAQESGFKFLHQLGGGPALGIYQMEPATERDIWDNYLAYREQIAKKVQVLCIKEPAPSYELIGNLYYATAMARIHYRRVSEPLPSAAVAAVHED